MVVVGGKHSSNTTKLYEIAKKNCENTIHIENAKEISKDILKDKDIKTIVTAGASTPDDYKRSNQLWRDFKKWKNN